MCVWRRPSALRASRPCREGRHRPRPDAFRWNPSGCHPERSEGSLEEIPRCALHPSVQGSVRNDDSRVPRGSAPLHAPLNEWRSIRNTEHHARSRAKVVFQERGLVWPPLWCRGAERDTTRVARRFAKTRPQGCGILKPMLPEKNVLPAGSTTRQICRLPERVAKCGSQHTDSVHVLWAVLGPAENTPFTNDRATPNLTSGFGKEYQNKLSEEQGVVSNKKNWRGGRHVAEGLIHLLGLEDREVQRFRTLALSIVARMKGS